MTGRSRIWRMRGGLMCRCWLSSLHHFGEIEPGQFCVAEGIIQWAELQNLSFKSKTRNHGRLSSSLGSSPTSLAPRFAVSVRYVRWYHHFHGWLCCSGGYAGLQSSRRHRFELSLNDGDSGASSCIGEQQESWLRHMP